MPWRGLEGDRDVFDIALETGDYVGLVVLTSAWRAWTAAGREGWGPSSSRYTTGRRRCLPGSERRHLSDLPDRFRRTRVPDPTGMVGAARPHRLGGGAGLPPRLERRGATGTSSAAIWPACGKSWATCGAWGWIPSTSAPSSRPRRTTATAPGTMRRSTPCWAPGPTSAPVRRGPRPGHAGGAGRRVQPPGLCQPLFQATAPMSARGRSSPRTALLPGTTSHHWPDKYDSWWGIYSLRRQ